MQQHALVSLSGGMDSATVLAAALDTQRIGALAGVEAIGFRYDSKHNHYELEAAQAIAKHYAVKFGILDLRVPMHCLKSNLLQSGGDIPEGHYQAESMKQTVVPGRNMIFISFLAGFAQSWKEEAQVWLGIHAGDHAIYPDCRPEFFKAMNEAVVQSTEYRVSLRAPFLRQTKLEIISYGKGLGVPYQLTRTCYKDQPVACGKCGSCQERLEAFAQNGMYDPIRYAEDSIHPTLSPPRLEES